MKVIFSAKRSESMLTALENNNSEALFIESSSGLLQGNIPHTLEDALKLVVEYNGALYYILSRFKNSRFQAALEKSTFDVQIIKDSITLSKINLKEDGLWDFVELRSADKYHYLLD
ncbi:hypothetical protein HPULCUR_005107 [Helicostylum pulchrum]|uniref:Uncharacterized protein n=1 Tax=Helicostylum pulchrum TaxID=562976 RepID=A0ABP9XZ59_9FUNG